MPQTSRAFWGLGAIFFVLSAIWGTGQLTGLVPALPDEDVVELFSNPPAYSDSLVSYSLERFASEGDADVGGFMTALPPDEDGQAMAAERAFRSLDQPGAERANYPYASQVGLQYLVAREWVRAGLPPKAAVAVFSLLNALGTGLLVAAIAIWARTEISAAAGLVTFAAFVASPMFLERASSIYWCNALAFAPFVFSLYLYPVMREGWRLLLFLASIAALFFIKSLAGYEFLTNIALGAAVPVVYYEIKAGGGLSRKAFGRILLVGTLVVIAAVIGFAGAFGLHAIRAAALFDGDLAKGLEAAILPSTYSLTSGDSSIRENLSTSPMNIAEALIRTYAGRNFVLNVALWGGFFVGLRLMLRAKAQRGLSWAQMPDKIRFLLLTLPFAVIACLSWHVFALVHAVAHSHVIWFTVQLNLLPIMAPATVLMWRWARTGEIVRSAGSLD
ncbi:MAG: hypothetical protein ACI87T_001331 [Planctomycetota bacterium]|jgi:hypothetical protein